MINVHIAQSPTWNHLVTHESESEKWIFWQKFGEKYWRLVPLFGSGFIERFVLCWLSMSSYGHMSMQRKLGAMNYNQRQNSQKLEEILFNILVVNHRIWILLSEWPSQPISHLFRPQLRPENTCTHSLAIFINCNQFSLYLLVLWKRRASSRKMAGWPELAMASSSLKASFRSLGLPPDSSTLLLFETDFGSDTRFCDWQKQT